MAKLTGRLDIRHGNRLSAHGVVRHRQHHKRHISLVFYEHFLEFFERHIALERQFLLRVLRLVDGHVDGFRLAALDVAFRRVEMGVARNNVTLLHQIREQYILGCATLMRRNHVLKTENALHHRLELVERRRTGITLVAQHQLGPLAVAHRACSRVGQAVDIDLLGLQHKLIVMGFLEPLFSLFACALSEWFDHLDLPRLCKWYFHKFRFDSLTIVLLRLQRYKYILKLTSEIPKNFQRARKRIMVKIY